jgi:hypothetical protein
MYLSDNSLMETQRHRGHGEEESYCGIPVQALRFLPSVQSDVDNMPNSGAKPFL